MSGIPLHLRPDDHSVIAYGLRFQLLLEMAALNPNGFRRPRQSKRVRNPHAREYLARKNGKRAGRRHLASKEHAYRVDFVARMASLVGKDRLAAAALKKKAAA